MPFPDTDVLRRLKLYLSTYLITFYLWDKTQMEDRVITVKLICAFDTLRTSNNLDKFFTKTETQFSHQVTMEFPIKRNNQTVICSIPSLINIISSLVQGTIEFVFYLSESLQCVKIFSLITRSRNYFHTRKLSHQRIWFWVGLLHKHFL